MAQVLNFLIVIVIMWFAGYATLMIMGLHGWYLGKTKSLLRAVWNSQRSRIIWATVGFLLALALLQP